MGDLGQFLVDQVWLWTSLVGIGLFVASFTLSLSGDDLAPMFVMASVPVQRELLIGHGDTHLTYTQAAVAGFAAGALIRFVAGQLVIRVDAVTITALVVPGMYAMTTVVADSTKMWAGETYRWLVAAWFLAVARSYFSQRSAEKLAIVLAAGIVLAAIWAAGQIIFDSGPPSFVRMGVMRAHGSFGEPNPFSAFIAVIMLPMVAFAVFSQAAPRIRLGAGLVAGAGIFALAATQSKGGLLGFTAGAVAIGAAALFQRSRRTQLTFSIGAAGAVTAVVLFLAIAAPWYGEGEETSPANWANQERSAHWSAAIEMAVAHPILGVGAGEFSSHYRAATTNWRFRTSRGHAHNAYLQVAAEAGLPALLAYIVMLASITGSLIRRMAQDPSRWLAIGAQAMTAALAVHQLVDFLHVLSLGLLFAGLWAAALSIEQKGVSLSEHNCAA